MAASKVVPMLLLTIVTASIAGITKADWCVAKPDATKEKLQAALDWACGHGADCGPIQPNGPCFIPNTVKDHASYAFDSYYQRQKKAPGSCDFSGSAIITNIDPGSAKCKYPSFERSVGGPNDNAKSKRKVAGDVRKLAQTLPAQKQ